jgi:hypothetical protein
MHRRIGNFERISGDPTLPNICAGTELNSHFSIIFYQ